MPRSPVSHKEQQRNMKKKVYSYVSLCLWEIRSHVYVRRVYKNEQNYIFSVQIKYFVNELAINFPDIILLFV